MDVAHEVEGVVLFRPLRAVELKWVLPSEAVVRSLNDVRVGDREPLIVWGKLCGEFFEGAELGAEIELVAVEQDRQDSLCGACVRNYLRCEKHRRRIVLLQ